MERSLPLPLGAVLLGAVLLLLGPLTASARAAACPGAAQPAYAMSGKAAAKTTLCLLNKERAARGIKPLRFDHHQQKAAARHNRLMLKKNCFSHECPGEKDLVGRITAAGYLPCSCSWGVAENLAWGSGRTAAPAAVVDAWMNSPSHRANVLNRRYDEIGVAVHDGSPVGAGSASTYTTDFGFKS